MLLENVNPNHIHHNGPATISRGVHEFSRDKISRDFVRNALQSYSPEVGAQRPRSSALTGSEFSLDLGSESLGGGDLGSLSATSSIQGVLF